MALPEGYLPRKGDVLTIRATVKHDVDPGEDTVYVSFRKYDDTSVDLAAVVGIFCRHWVAGEKVRLISDNEILGQIIATDDTSVWVKLSEDGSFKTFNANQIELDAAPQPPEKSDV
jgi:hypothetical protein